MRFRWLAMAVVWGVVCVGQASYSVTPVIVPPGYHLDHVSSFNNLGQAAGTAVAADGSYVIFASTGDSSFVVPLPAVPTGLFPSHVYINRHGQIAGDAGESNYFPAFFGTTSGVSYLLLTPDSHGLAPISSAIAAINDSGQFVGTNYDSVGAGAFIGTSSGVSQIPFDVALGINNAGAILAETFTPFGVFIVTGSSTVSVAALGDIVFGINDRDQVVGVKFSGPFVRSLNGTVVLPRLIGFPYERQVAINNIGTVVGESSDGFQTSVAWIWDPIRGIQALTPLVPTGWTIISARAINDSGQILASAGVGPIPAPRDVILTPLFPALMNPTLIAPVNGGSGVPTSGVLTWQALNGADSYDVYFGTTPDPPLVGNTTSTSFSVDHLSQSTVYYWRVIAKNSGPATATSDVWSFTTITGPCDSMVSPPGAAWPAAGGASTIAITNGIGCNWIATSNVPWIAIKSGVSGSGNGAVGYSVAANTGAARVALIVIAGLTYNVTQASTDASARLHFVPVTPCRIADTRNPVGPFGGPPIAGNTSRDFVIPASNCNIPPNAGAYSLNMTVVPSAGLGFLQVWPAGESQPAVSTLNSPDGRIKANAAIVPAGVNGAVTVFASNATDVIIDINGYFVADPNNQALAFYPLAPCRIADTRQGAGEFGGPKLSAGISRDFHVEASGCGVPLSAGAFALNLTVVPPGPVGFLSAWPAGTAQPGVSTLNDPTGTIVPNAAIVPAGVGGAISLFATHPTDVIIDINGYFAPPGGQGALSFYPQTPCRALDTRISTGPFGGPILAANTPREVPMFHACNFLFTAAAQAYSLNATVVPPAGLGFLQLWNTGGPQPGVSTLNASDGFITSNAAIVPAGTNGSITVYASNATHLILDINGYFAP